MLQRLLLLLLLLGGVCFNSTGMNSIDSVAIRYLSSIVNATSDTDRINKLKLYADILLQIDRDSAMAIYNTILEESLKCGYRNGVNEYFLTQGKVAYWNGDFNTSDSFYTLVATDSTNTLPYKIRAFTGIANGFAVQGLYEAAADNYYNAINLIERLDDSTFKSAYIYANISVVWNLIGNLDKAFTYLEQAERIAFAQKDSTQIINILNKKGNYMMLKDTVKALQLYTASFDISKAYSDLPNSLMAAGNLTRLYIYRGDIVKAKEYLQYSLDVIYNRKIHMDVFHKLSVKNGIAHYYYLLGDTAAAEREWLSTISTAKRLKARQYTLVPYEHLSRLYGAKGDYVNAYRYLLLHASLKDSIVTSEKIKALDMLEDRFIHAQQKRQSASLKLIEVERAQSIAKRNRIIGVLFLCCLLVFLVIFSIYQYSKNKNLLLKELTLLKRKEQQLKQLQANLEGKERERQRISRELHDGIGSLLSVAKMNISSISAESINARTEIRDAVLLLDNTAKNVRSIAHSLTPDILLKGGIEEAFQVFCNYTSRSRNVVINFQSYGGVVAMDASLERDLFSVLQDILLQLMQETKASKVKIQFNWNIVWLYVTMEADEMIHNTPKENDEIMTDWYFLRSQISGISSNLEIVVEPDLGTMIELEFDLTSEKNI